MASFTYLSDKKCATISIDNIYPEQICDESNSSSDSDVPAIAYQNYDTSDTITDQNMMTTQTTLLST